MYCSGTSDATQATIHFKEEFIVLYLNIPDGLAGFQRMDAEQVNMHCIYLGIMCVHLQTPAGLSLVGTVYQQKLVFFPSSSRMLI